MSVSGIQGHLLEVTVVGCSKLKDTEWISRQDPYVCVEYGTNKSRTRTCTDGGKNPTFQEKFVFTLIEGLREMHIVVWNSNTITTDDFIGSGKVQLQKVLSEGYDDGNWPLQTKTGRYGGEVRLIMHYPKAKKSDKPFAPSAPPYAAPPPAYPVPQVSMYARPPPAYPVSYGPPVTAYMVSSTYPAYPPNPAYPPLPSAYPPPLPAAYPPPQYPPPSVYPPTPYPPPPQPSSYYPPPPGSYPGTYPPPY